MRLGLGDRPYFQQTLMAGLPDVDFVEVVAEHYFEQQKVAVAQSYPCVVHSLALSLGSPDPLDMKYVENVARVAELVDAPFTSDHLAYTKAGGVDLGHLNPVPLDEITFRLMAQKIKRVQETTGRKLLLENIATHLAVPGGIPEPLFLNKMCEETGCGLLLDVTNLYVNAFNHQFDSERYLEELDLRQIGQIHIIGYGEADGYLHDEHGNEIQMGLLQLLGRVLDAVADTVPVLIEWDQNFPERSTLLNNLSAVSRVIDESNRNTYQTAV